MLSPLPESGYPPPPMARRTANAVPQLSHFEGRDVLQSTIRVTNAGDGLSAAKAVEPDEFHLGDTVTVVLECEVSKVHYEELGDTGTLRRVHTFKAGTATIVSSDLVKDALEDQRIKIERSKGVERLDFADAVEGDEPAEGDGGSE